MEEVTATRRSRGGLAAGGAPSGSIFSQFLTLWASWACGSSAQKTSYISHGQSPSAPTAYFITSLLVKLLPHGVNRGAPTTLKCAPQRKEL